MCPPTGLLHRGLWSAALWPLRRTSINASVHCNFGSGIQVLLAVNVTLQHVESTELFSALFSAEHY